MEDDVLARFAAIVGDAYALRDAKDIEPFVNEQRGLFGGRSPLVLRPGSVAEVSAIMRLATETRTAVVPQGGNTGLVGGQMPDQTGTEIVLSLARLNRIRELDPLANTVIAEAGVVLENLHKAAESIDRLYPLTLGSQGSCQVGGNLSTNAGGVAVLSYGNARELCLGVEVVLPTGEVFDDLRKLKKDNTGYDLKNLFVGAEGTLGIITAAVLKLFPRPKGREIVWISLNSPEDALGLLSIASEKAGSALTAFELIARLPVEFAERHIPGSKSPVGLSSPWFVLTEVSSGRSADDAREVMEAILQEAMERALITDAAVAASLAQGEALWQLRENLSEAQKFEGASIKHDISVPVSSIPEFITRAAPEVERVCPGARVVCFGHMGDGNLHYNIAQPPEMDKAAFLALYRPINHAVHDVARSLVGSFSAEHGIGRLKRAELLETAPPVGIDLMRRIKAAFDPAGIMNPGKVI